MVSVAVITSAPAGATTLEAFNLNREGLKKFEKKSYFPAYQDFLKALTSDPLNPELHLNLARALEANEEFAKAEKIYQGALQLLAKDSSLRFEALFNLAGTQAKLKKIDEALATYQSALELNPDSIETKTNIELLWQGGGGGEGENQEQNPQNQGKSGGQGDQQKDKPQPQQKKQPKPFESQHLSSEDVKRILDEIKNQEQSIRANEYDKSSKDSPKAKDW